MLKHLRHPLEDRVVWIDALSIDQANVTERNSQVRQIGKIYQAAAAVCIWLGPAAESSDLAMDFIPRILDFTTLDESVRDSSYKEHWLALSRLMAREWFTRRWVVQEVALARRANLHCGRKIVPWSDFVDATALFGSKWQEIIQMLPQTQAFEIGDIPTPGAERLVTISNNIFRKDGEGNIQECCFDFETVLATLPMFEASDILDTVYAVLALAKETYNGKEIEVNYSISPLQLFTSIVSLAVRTSGSLDIICRPWAPSCELPSWIMSVSEYAFVRRPGGQYDRQNADNLVGPPGRRFYNAAGGRAFNGSIPSGEDIGTSTIVARGFIVDRIRHTGDCCVHGIIPADWLTLGGWHDRARSIPSSFWRTLVADRGSDGTAPPNWYARACEYSFRLAGSPDIDTSKLIRACRSSNVKDFLRRVQVTAWNRIFFRTTPVSDVGCIGLAPAKAKVGDFICILFGCSVPVVLRRDNGFYRLIGECFTYGIMDGEAISAFDSGIYSAATFGIR
jgi:hypothetical protein